MYEKLYIFYEPDADAHIQSFSVSFYDFDLQAGTYKRKIVLQKDNVKYKIKDLCTDIDAFVEKIASVDFSNRPEHPRVNDNGACYFIKYGDHQITTQNREDIDDILQTFGFDHFFELEAAKY